MHWQRALELLILHETQSLDSSHAAELVSCWRGWPDASGTSPSDAPLELLRRDLSARPPRRERVGGGKMWGRGERRFSFAGKTGSDSVVHTHPYLNAFLVHSVCAAFWEWFHFHAFSTPFVCILYCCILRSRRVCISMHSLTCCILDMMHFNAL